MKNNRALVVVDPWWGEQMHLAGEVEESEKPTHSKLLGPNGQPIPYKRQKLGFDLTPKHRKNND